MTQLQSIIAFLGLVVLGFSPLIYAQARTRDKRDETEQHHPLDEDLLPEVLSPVQALGRNLFGEAYHWSSIDMLNYDHTPWVREPWERAASRRLHPSTNQQGETE